MVNPLIRMIHLSTLYWMTPSDGVFPSKGLTPKCEV